jgi:hypothetical protein
VDRTDGVIKVFSDVKAEDGPAKVNLDHLHPEEERHGWGGSAPVDDAVQEFEPA